MTLKPNQQIIKIDKRIYEACEALRHFAEHPNQRPDIFLHGAYHAKDPESLYTVAVDGVIIGYKVKESSPLEMNPYFDRYAYMKVPGHRLEDLSRNEMAAICTAMFEAFFEPQQGKIHDEQTGDDALLFWQRFMVAFPVELNKDLVSIAGGVNLDGKGLII